MQSEKNEFVPNGLLSNKETSLAKVLDKDRWSQAEARTAEMLALVQPNQTSEQHRNAVVSYLRSLLMKCVPCQVFIFGSVPLKTYLPDGDIDLTAFGEDQFLKDSLIQQVLKFLENEEKNENAEFHVKEVQFIQAEVKIIKCLVGNFVVDISFNQLGGLGTLCFLEEVDRLIKQNHLFKRSIILIKAWCYYESRILGSHHGLMSTYALEILVLYIFHVYSSAFAGPLEVLFRFLDFFSKFDWNNYCLSLWGPVPIGSLANMKAEPPRKDCKELLFSEPFLKACKTCYGVMPSIQENKEKPFVSKYFNIVDPLRANNNLGRSISKSNFCRIKSAIGLGAQRILRLLECPEDNLLAEFDLFFKNTWDRNGNGYWIDAHSYKLYIKNNKDSTSHEPEVDASDHLEESKPVFGTSDVSVASQTWSPKTNDIFTGAMTSNIDHSSSLKNALTNPGQDPTYSSNEVHNMHHFFSFYTSPELAHIYSEVPTEHGYSGVSEIESGQIHCASSMIGTSSSSRPEVFGNHSIRIPSENQQSFGQLSYDWRSEDAVDSDDTSSGYYYEYGLGVNNENVFPVDEAILIHQEDHDFPYFNEYLQAPMDANSSNVYFPPPPPPLHVLASGYRHENSFGELPVDVPSFEPFLGHNMPYSQDSVPFPSFEWYPNSRAALNEEEITEPVDYNVLLAHSDLERQMAVNIGSSSGNSSCQSSSRSYNPKGYAVTTEQKCWTRGKGVAPPVERNIHSDVNSRESSSYTPASHSTSRTKLSSSSLSIGSSSKTSQPDGVGGDWICQSTMSNDLHENTTAETAVSYAQALLRGRQGPMTVSNSSLPDTLHVGPGSSQRAVDNQSSLPLAFGSLDQSFQAPTLLPFCNLPTETGTGLDIDAELCNLYTPESSVSHDATLEDHVKEISDILTGDFGSYLVNLQYGRFCQNSQALGPLLQPLSFMSPMYLRGQFPWYRKPSSVRNILGHSTPVPVMPAIHASALHRSANQRMGFWLPRFSDGTGTYLPNPITYNERYFRNKHYQKNQNENYKYEKKVNQGEKEKKLNLKESSPSRGQSHNKLEKPGTNKSSHQGEGSRSANKQAKSERDTKDSSRQPSSSKTPGAQKVGRSAGKRK